MIKKYTKRKVLPITILEYIAFYDQHFFSRCLRKVRRLLIHVHRLRIFKFTLILRHELCSLLKFLLRL